MTHIAGIHHVTCVGADPDRTLKFYTDTLGLQLVRKTVNFDEPSVLHFYFGHFTESPRALLTFFIHNGAARGRRGTGQVSSVVLAVPSGSLPDWRERLVQQRVEVVGRAWAFGQEYLCFSDPDGLELALVEEVDDSRRGIAPNSSEAQSRAIRRIRSVEIQVEGFQRTSRFLVETLGLNAVGNEGAVFRFRNGPTEQSVAVDVLCTPNHRPGNAGPGVVHHIAWRVPDTDALSRMAEALVNCGFDITPPLDRYYFRAIYFRTPCGLTFAVVTDTPGFAVEDKRPGADAELSLPPWLEPQRAAITRRLSRRHTRSSYP
ncbi:MAG: glyoxalase family protein [Acetobacteraceae bacterium]|nr:glyoxalase family protein [Acetobacteraceae bacterium]MEA2768747.1 glyoxalase family protein [Acetobacteraceae bacterium]